MKPQLPPEEAESWLTSPGLGLCVASFAGLRWRWTPLQHELAPTWKGRSVPISSNPSHPGRLTSRRVQVWAPSTGFALGTTQPGTDRPCSHRSVAISETLAGVSRATARRVTSSPSLYNSAPQPPVLLTTGLRVFGGPQTATRSHHSLRKELSGSPGRPFPRSQSALCPPPGGSTGGRHSSSWPAPRFFKISNPGPRVTLPELCAVN